VTERIPVVVTEVVPAAAGIREFVLARQDGESLPAFSGGSHVIVHMHAGSRRHSNPYSLMGDPADASHYRIAVQRQAQSRGGSAFLHDRVTAGHCLEISPPVNLFPVARLARHHVLFAGGIGVTPILAQCRDLRRLGLSFEVHHSYRTPELALRAEDLHGLAGGRYHRYCSAEGARLAFEAVLEAQPLGTHLYVCGPERFITAARSAALKLGWPAGSIHSEQFLAPPTGAPFEAHLARSGVVVSVPSDQSLLEAIEQAGVAARSLCRGGACGQCETGVLEVDGCIEHHDVFLSDADKAAGQRIMPCVSRIAGPRIVLDL
jgi:ferredoxin-NADP reductase